MTHENKFGMFVHWGVYAMLGLQEQAICRYQIPSEEYEGLAKEFNPVDYDPEEWVLLAKSAGMKYICFTTKHHDGFCMWDTGQTDYNIMNTPYGKDVLKLLADACHKYGTKPIYSPQGDLPSTGLCPIYSEASCSALGASSKL